MKIIKGNNATGSKTNAAATDSTSSWSVISLLKGILLKLLASINVVPVTSAGAQVTGATGAAVPAGAVAQGITDGTNLNMAREITADSAAVSRTGVPAVGMILYAGGIDFRNLVSASAVGDGGTLTNSPMVGLAGFNNTNYDRLRSGLTDPAVGTGLLNTLLTMYDSNGPSYRALRAAAGVPDGSARTYGLVTAPYLDNGDTLDRQRNNTEATAISSAARTATAESAVLTNYNGRGIQVAVHASAKVAATTLRVDLLVRDSVSGVYAIKASSTAFAAVAGTTYVVDFAPGVLDADYAAGGDGRNVLVPRLYKVQTTPGDASEVTYGASVSTI